MPSMILLNHMKNFLKQKNIGQNILSNTKGFTLIETLVAISIFTVSILALMSVLGQGISNTNYAKQKMIASYLAQEGIEYIRNMRDTKVLYDGSSGWGNFRSQLNSCNSGQGCSFDPILPYEFNVCNDPHDCALYINNGGYDTNSSGVDSGFIRKIWMEKIGNGSNEVKIFSDVSWTQGSGSYNISFSESLFNWVE